MKLYSILILRKDADKAKILASQFDLSSFGYFQRGSVQEFMNFSATTIAERTQPGQRQSVESENNVAHVYAHPQGISGMIISDKDYPSRVAFSLLNKILDEFLVKFPTNVWKSVATLDYPELADYLRKYQDPQQADTIMKVQKELDETTAILHKTIDSVLQRGEKLDSLVDRSEALSSQSKMFYKTAKKTNSCCVVM
ncbi:Longin-like domain-containing protein [Cokeromyces recurvatus]|uniref:Longin-like domain-containing protein n=1 Tax=Cokeromyces recurvatus TaxID=90255 RepID=UPI00221F0053|nr:Longin-like domain-containing protein [Cokeromyces recurvatus]KAI7906032.1 Longin-like domain-containing protein [Cokeromyces recurvatus]